jgi:carbonic anhydrase/acetyltransferase-like protein (isoleucine patch superfamily)
MKVLVLDTSLPILPFGEPARDLPVLGLPLFELQRRVLVEAGCEPVETPPADEPYLCVGSRCWFTPPLVARFVAEARDRLGRSPGCRGLRLRLVHPTFQRLTEPLQRLPAPGVHELVFLAPGTPPGFEGAALLDLAPDLLALPSPELHPGLSMRGIDELVQGDEMVVQVDHWALLQQANVLAMAAWSHEQRRRFFEGPLLPRLWRWVRLVLRARSLDPFRLAAALVHRGPGCIIHPTAIIEASVLGRGVVVGPCAVVRGCLVGDGCRIDQHAGVAFSVLGRNVRVTQGAEVNLCVVMDGAMLSRAAGMQASVIGRDAFVAQSAVLMDRAFEGEVRVLDEGTRAGSGRAFLGVAVGHRARVGAGVVMGYGSQLPNDSSLVIDSGRVFREWRGPGDRERQ